jgi:hypothetical protein
MRYLRRLVLNSKTPSDSSIAVSIGGEIIFDSPYNVTLPRGTNSQKSVDNTTFVDGMIRYNTDTDQFQGYQDGAWRNFRFKESTSITQQSLGSGNDISKRFGTLNPAPPSTVESGTTWGGQNLIVVVENVFQVHTTNYTVVQNPVTILNLATNKSGGETTIDFADTSLIVPGSTVAANNISGTVVSVDSTTDITISNPVASALLAGEPVTFTAPTGYYIQFDSAVPLNKPVIVYHGFDQ